MKTLVAISCAKLKKMIFDSEAIAALSSFSEVEWLEEGKSYSSGDLLQYLRDCDACVTSWGSPRITKDIVNESNLKFIGHAAGTVVPYVDETVFEKGIVVVNANSALARSTAEGALALMMAGAWRIRQYNAGIQQGIWSDNNCETVPGLYKQVIGLVGYGDISREVIRLLKPFEAKIFLYSNHCTKQEAETLGVQLCSLEELLRTCKIISIHNTLTSSTRGMIGRKEMDLIQEGALLVNTARARIIDEEALVEYLRKGKFHAALDVFWQEPITPENELMNLPNVLCTPHIAGFSHYWKSRLARTVIDDMKRWVNGEALKGEITRERFLRLTPR